MQLIALPYDGPVKMYDFDDGAEILADAVASAPFIYKGSKEHRKKYYNIIMTFDIETTKVLNAHYNPKEDPNSLQYFNFPFCWQCSINGKFIFDREIDKFFDMLLRGMEKADGIVICYIHNLAFEYGNLRDYFNAGILTEDDYFFKNPSAPLFLRYHNKIEFRCSRQLTGKSLEKIGKDIGYDKLKGDFDYSIERDCSTKLSREEVNYCYRDVMILHKFLDQEYQAYCKSINAKKSNICRLPLTSTGYVRKDIQKAFSNTSKGRYVLKNTKLIEEDYMWARGAFWGGYTHSNFRHIGEEVGGVMHGDLTSAYPWAFLHKVPMRFTDFVNVDNKLFMEMLKSSDHFAILVTLRFKGLNMNKGTVPYVPTSKVTFEDGTRWVEENGKVILALGWCSITMCDIDARIILSNYHYEEMEIVKGKFSLYEDIPYSVVNTVIDYFMKKTVYKNVEGKEVEYNLSKSKLNSIYGLSATALIHSVYKMIDGSIEEEGYEYKEAYVLPFQWAIWITARVRHRIFTMIQEMNKRDLFIYSDTDSIFFREDPEILKFIKQLNDDNYEFLKYKQMLYYYLLPKSPEGVEQHLGEFLYEDYDYQSQKSTIKRFCTIGAKRYYVQHEDDTYDVTFSGLRATKRKNGKNGYNTQRLIDRYGTLNKAFNTIKERSVSLEYVEGVDKLSNYNIIYPFEGYLLGNLVKRPCTYTLYPQSIRLSLNPSLKAFLADVLFEDYE